MARLIIKVDGMSCEHCVAAVTGALGALAGVSSVEVSLEAGSVAVEYGAPATEGQIKAEIEEQGYGVAG